MAFRIDRAEKKNSYNNLILQELFVFYRRLAYLSVIQLGLWTKRYFFLNISAFRIFGFAAVTF